MLRVQAPPKGDHNKWTQELNRRRFFMEKYFRHLDDAQLDADLQSVGRRVDSRFYEGLVQFVESQIDTEIDAYMQDRISKLVNEWHMADGGRAAGMPRDGGGGGTAMHRKGGGTPPLPPSRAHSLCPATVPLTPSAGLNGICNRQ